MLTTEKLLLDALRHTNVIEGEAGGPTRIGTYQSRIFRVKR